MDPPCEGVAENACSGVPVPAAPDDKKTAEVALGGFE
jgi:hypothetical protein